MKQTRLIMGMPITVEIVGTAADTNLAAVFDYFSAVDERYSTYKPSSEISRINNGLPPEQWSTEMKRVLELCEETKQLTHGYFDIMRGGVLDPSGLVKGWAIHNAAVQLLRENVRNFSIEAGGDVQTHGRPESGDAWRVGIRNPFNVDEIIKVISLRGEGVATSGAYIRGPHIYNPHDRYRPPKGLQSLTVVGPNVYEADRFATAAFAMGLEGAAFIEAQPGLEGYAVDDNKMATYTSGFERYVIDA